MRCEIRAANGDSLLVDLEEEGTRATTTLLVNGVPCHLERLPAGEATHYVLDDDPEYSPQADDSGFCYVLVPYSAE